MQVINQVVTDSPPSSPAAVSFTHLLAWLASSFATVIKQQKALAFVNNPLQQSANAVSLDAAIPLSADFHFAAVLLQPLLVRLKLASDTDTSTVTANLSSSQATAATAGVLNRTAAPDTAAAGNKQNPEAKTSKRQRGRGKQKATAVAETQAGKHAKDGVLIQWSTAAEGAALLVKAMADGNIYR